MARKSLFCALLCVALYAAPGVFAESPVGADKATDLYSPVLSGGDGFITGQEGSPSAALNPAAEGGAQRIIFDAGYLAIVDFSPEKGLGHAASLGAVFPTKYASFGGSIRFLHSSFSGFPIGTTFGGNLNIAKELYPGMSVGAGFNFGFGDDWTASGDLGFRYNMGKLGFLENFTWAVVMRSMGKSWIPKAFTPLAGVSFDLFRIRGNDGKPDPLRFNLALDIGSPGFTNMTVKAGAAFTIAEIVTVSAAEDINIRETIDGYNPSFIPSVGIGVNFALRSGGRRLAGGRLPSDGDLGIHTAQKPLYGDIRAMGAGVTWHVGVVDKRPPLIAIEYPETQYISPNNDGKADLLEFPVSITDQRYISQWVLEIKDASGAVARTYRNKELRTETQGVRNIINRLIAVKSGVEVPESLKWDGILESGSIAEDGSYFFTLSATDDSGNSAVSPSYEVIVDNTPPEVRVTAMEESARIFSPDGDGSKDTITINQTGSPEDRWEAGIFNARGTEVKTFVFRNGSPEAITWDGTDNQGRIVNDGVYSYQVRATDKAQNTGSAAMENIIVNTVQPTVSLQISDAWFSPNGDGVKDTITLTPGVPVKDGIVSWAVRIKDAAGAARRTISASSAVPGAIEYDGKNDQNTVLGEAVYQAELEVTYRNGYVSTAASPSFTLDTTPPRASLRTEYSAFSPNNDGKQDWMVFLQEGSEENLWIGEIRRADGPNEGRAVRSIRFVGLPRQRLEWDGMDNSGALAADGNYTYQLSSTDPAGNTGRSNIVTFSLSTADTPVLLSTDLRAFSPNGDGVKDTINLLPQLQVTTGITSWKLDILNSAGAAVRTFEGQNSVPGSVPWNGRTSANAVAPDGTYTARFEARYAMGNQPSAQSRPFELDTSPPRAEISAPYTVFSPNDDSRKDTLPVAVRTEGNDTWEAVITNAQGRAVKSWTWTGAAPAIAWDGTDQAGNKAPDGTYRLALNGSDEAGNSARFSLDAITLDARVPRAILTSSANAVAPKGDPNAEVLRFGMILSLKEGIDNWKLELKDESGAVQRTFPAPGTPRNQAPPESLGWNGLDSRNVLREGKFTPVLTVLYTKGDEVSVSAPAITVDVSGPVLSFSSRPEYFSPDNDGVDDELLMALGAQDISPIGSWTFEIREPVAPYQLFYRLEGRGSPAEQITWDGRSYKGELVQAATDYPFTYSAVDILGNSSSMEGSIGVDVLVIRDGNNLRIQVPSIIFRENAADFNSLARDTVDNNNRVLRRVAEILNKFRDYQVKVEGHANPVARTAAEENNELRPLSDARARAVVDMLTGFGVNRSRLSAVGMGGSRPVVRWEDRDNWWKNRRVEFILVK